MIPSWEFIHNEAVTVLAVLFVYGLQLAFAPIYFLLLLFKYLFRKVVDSKDRADNPLCRNGFEEENQWTVKGQLGHLLIATLKCPSLRVVTTIAMADKAT